MTPAPHSHSQSSPPAHAQIPLRIGCVSFLNAKPLIHNLAPHPDAPHVPAAAHTSAQKKYPVLFDVPSKLLEHLENRLVDVALCPVIDYQTSKEPLAIIPAGGIGCDGPTLTVRLYSRVELPRIKRVRIDSDSHTSIALMRVLLRECWSVTPELLSPSAPASSDADAILLIGDKVITHSPDPALFPHQIDLGQAWKEHTGLPFLFAVWMGRPGDDLAHLAQTLDETRRNNSQIIDEIARLYAPRHHWPIDIAAQYLGHWLRFDVGQRQLQAVERFYSSCHALGIIPRPRPLLIQSFELATA